MSEPSRSVEQIRAAGAAWVTETELKWLCDAAEALRWIAAGKTGSYGDPVSFAKAVIS